MGLHSQTAQSISEEYGRKRHPFKNKKRRGLASGEPRRALGWIPFKASAISYQGGPLRYGELQLGVWDSYGLSGYELGTGCLIERSGPTAGEHFSQDCGALRPRRPQATASYGIDLGLRELAAFSDPTHSSMQAQQFFKDLELKRSQAGRAGSQKSSQAIHAPIRNRRKGFLNKLLTERGRSYGDLRQRESKQAGPNEDGQKRARSRLGHGQNIVEAHIQGLRRGSMR